MFIALQADEFQPPVAERKFIIPAARDIPFMFGLVEQFVDLVTAIRRGDKAGEQPVIIIQLPRQIEVEDRAVGKFAVDRPGEPWPIPMIFGQFFAREDERAIGFHHEFAAQATPADAVEVGEAEREIRAADSPAGGQCAGHQLIINMLADLPIPAILETNRAVGDDDIGDPAGQPRNAEPCAVEHLDPLDGCCGDAAQHGAGIIAFAGDTMPVDQNILARRAKSAITAAVRQRKVGDIIHHVERSARCESRKVSGQVNMRRDLFGAAKFQCFGRGRSGESRRRTIGERRHNSAPIS